MNTVDAPAGLDASGTAEALAVPRVDSPKAAAFLDRLLQDGHVTLSSVMRDVSAVDAFKFERAFRDAAHSGVFAAAELPWRFRVQPSPRTQARGSQGRLVWDLVVGDKEAYGAWWEASGRTLAGGGASRAGVVDPEALLAGRVDVMAVCEAYAHRSRGRKGEVKKRVRKG